MPTTEETLLHGMIAHPGEVERWLILADWLEDHGDPRAELAQLRYHLHTEPDAKLATRQQALLAAGLAPVVPTWTNALGMRFALVPPGSFWMGSPPTEADRRHDEVRHHVTLTEPFGLGVTPVTVRQFGWFVEATGHRTQAEQDGDALTWRAPGFEQEMEHPVVCVSWSDAFALVEWLNAIEPGRNYRLPTEAQWEYACRAGSTTAYFWGDDPANLDEYAWAGVDATRSVFTKRPNAWGLWHLSGLVWEWCADFYDDYPTEPAQDPRGLRLYLTGGPDHPQMVLRGGGWMSAARSCRSATRTSRPAIEGRRDTGFRLAVTLGK